MSGSNQIRIAYKKAGAAITTWKTLRKTNDTLTVGTETLVSDEVRSDRKLAGSKVVTLTGGGTIDFEFAAGDFDDLLEAAFMSAWSTNSLEIGTTKVELDLLKSYTSIGKHVFIGKAIVSNLSIDMQAGQKITGQITVMGGEVDEDYAITTDTFAPAGDALFMDSSNNLGSLTVNGTAVSGMCFTGMSLDLDNSVQSDQCIGSLVQQHHENTAVVTGGITIRASAAAFDLWKNSISNTPIALGYTLSDGDKSYAVTVASAYLDGDLPSGGRDEILSFDMTYTAGAKANGDYLKIVRTV